MPLNEETGKILPKKTVSLCPKCLKKIPATLIEEDGQVIMKKECPDHGKFDDVYWSDVKMYQRALSWAHEGNGVENPRYPVRDGCPYDCGLCDDHLTPTVLANIDVTNRCNLTCPICFANAAAQGYVFEPSFKEIVAMLRLLRENRPPTPAIQFSGGEPTIHPDFVAMIKEAKKLGFSQIQVATNGIRLADKKGYAQELVDAGLKTVYLQFDGLDDNIYIQARGKPLLQKKIKAIEACRQTTPKPLSTVLVPTIVNTINDDQIGKIIHFALDNIDVIRGVNFQPVSFTGRIDDEERKKQRFTIPDLARCIQEQTQGAIQKDDFYPVPSMASLFDLASAMDGIGRASFTTHPCCGVATYIFVNGKEIIPITRFVDVDSFLQDAAAIAEKIKGKKTAKISGMVRSLRLLQYIDEKKKPKGLKIKDIMKEIIKNRDQTSLSGFHWKSLYIGSMHFQDAYNYDVERVQRCAIHYATPDGRIIPFCAYNAGPTYREEVEKKFSVPLEEYRGSKNKS